jgi:uncharacterized repeat protein (TIGR01451 family)
MGYCARVFDQAGLTPDQLASFQLVIWDDVGAGGLTDNTVQVLNQVFNNNIPLYVIGDRLIPAQTALSAPNQTLWLNLLHLASLGQSGTPGLISFSTASIDRQPGSILTGRSGSIEDFTYTNDVALAQVAAGATSLASAGGATLFAQYPDANTTDTGQARTVSQAFRVTTGGDAASLLDRKALFQNSVCWLLRCSYCDLIGLGVVASDLPENLKVGDQFTFTITISNNGECVAAATVLTNQLPAGLSLVSYDFNQGVSVDYSPQDHTLIWRVGTVVSGTENNAIISLTVSAVQPGQFHGSACATANYEIFNDANCAALDITIAGTSTPAAPSLTLLQTVYGAYQLRLVGDQGATYQIQTSFDLTNWLSWTNAPGPLFYLELPEVTKTPLRPKFYRARWP